MNVLNEEVRVLTSMLNFYKLQLAGCEATYREYVKSKIDDIEAELQSRLDKMENEVSL